MTRVLIVAEASADQRKTVAAARALAADGQTVTVASDTGRSPPLWSRACGNRRRCPDPCTNPAGFADWLMGEVDSGCYDVLLPLSDHTTWPLVERREALATRIGIALPTLASLQHAHDKLATLTLAKSLGIAVPATERLDPAACIEEVGARLGYPCVVKPRRGAGAAGLSFPTSDRELAASVRGAAPTADAVFGARELLAQKLISGDVHDVCALAEHGEIRAALTQRRVSMHPARGGVGVYNETTSDPELRDQATRLLAALRWHGPAQVEFRYDRRAGVFRLMEINGRFWGTLDLAIRAGINFPALASQLAMGGRVEPVFEYQVGLRYRWPWPYGVLRARESSTPWRELVRFYGPAPGVVSDWRWQDPLPSLLGIMNLR